jgi:ribulose-phosphate 3-epimerase
MAADYRRLEEDVCSVIGAGVDGLHFDVMDGNFVPNITFGKDLVAALRPLTELPFDAHLMVTQADLIAEQIIEAGANRVSVHPEVGGHLQRSLARIRELGAQPGVAINPATSPEAIEYVLVLSVNPGVSGQTFIPAARRKLEAIATMIDRSGRDVRITLDGGVEPSTVAELAALGARDFIAGGAIFYNRPAVERVNEFRRAMP